MDETPTLASDAEREQVKLALHEAVVEGRLTLTEFDARVERVHLSRTRQELVALASGLPAPSRALRPRRMLALWNSVRERPRLGPGGKLQVLAAWGRAVLDLRSLALTGGEVEIRAIAAWGSVVLIVPANVEIEVEGMAMLHDKRPFTPPVPDAARIRLRSVSLWGRVVVTDREPGAWTSDFDLQA
ncbi:MAG TPA: DUF1707 domain-containing protein [Oscillatoriaceae cyanobacterium]